MISVRCSELESVRENPAAHGQVLATNGIKSGGGRGMVSCVREVALAMGKEEFTVSEGVKQIQQKFLTFSPTKENKERQEELIQGFIAYHEQLKKHQLEFIDGSRRMKWDFSKDTRLTGQTPWVFASDRNYYALSLAETNTAWQHQLKYPLYQKYLTDHIINCHPSALNVGVFCLQTGKFEFKSFDEESIELSVNETGQILNTVLDSFNKYKN
ncbi:hypothetical protein [Niabella hirudinis]|uniref:hypothetical protein n=1 Tax=Niabella hirudinis TaxID=1285929 RepID=UPI003EBE0A3A